MILLAFEGKQNCQIADAVGCERHAVRTWRRRWKEAFEKLISVECNDTRKVLESAITEVLRDQHRCGVKPKFTPDQVTRILAIACEDPDEQSQRPVTHWTPTELADEASKRGIVTSISPSRVRHFLKTSSDQASLDSVLVEPQTV